MIPITTTTTIGTTTSGSIVFDGAAIFFLTAVGAGLVGSIVPVFTAIILLLSLFFCCICLLLRSCRRSFLRFISLNCNCPCYIPRPKLRFTIRIGFHLFCIVFRVVAVIFYGMAYMVASTDKARRPIYTFLLITVVSLMFPFLTIILDVYHYRVWWAYQPDIAISLDILEKPFSPKHKRFIPFTLTEPFRTNTFGNRRCQYGDRCQSRELEHVVIFHSSNYQPQPRWSNKFSIYIGFHRTTPQAAFCISKSDFNPSKSGMLGPGAYFARSTEATLSKIGKPDQTGAWFVAEIFMGNVFVVEGYKIRSDWKHRDFDENLRQYVKSGAWSHDYDTCYFKHYHETQDEFCIKNPAKQIRRWIITVEPPYDTKLFSYGLLSELDSSACGCV